MEDIRNETEFLNFSSFCLCFSEFIFKQGEDGNSCYIIQSGVFTVTIDDKNLKQLRKGHTFGELAMVYNVKRTATVTCSHNGVVWVMGASYDK